MINKKTTTIASLVFITVYANIFLLFIIGAMAQSNVLGYNAQDPTPTNVFLNNYSDDYGVD